MTDTSNIATHDQFFARLRAERERLRLTQPAAAKRLEIPFATYRSYESGRSEPPISFLARMTNAGMDSLFVAIGRSFGDRKGDVVDWVLLREIIQIVCSWSASRPRQLDPDETIRYVETAYRCASKLGSDAQAVMLNELRVA